MHEETILKISNETLINNKTQLEKELTTMPELKLLIMNNIKNIDDILKDRGLLILLFSVIGFLIAVSYDTPQVLTDIRSVFNFR